MASTASTAVSDAPVYKETSTEPLKSAPPPEVAEYREARGGGGGGWIDLALRVLLFATTVVAIVFMATSKQTEMIPVTPFMAVPVDSKFTYSPALIYFMAAMSVACLYSIITTLVSVFSLMKPGGSSAKLQFHFVIIDSLLLGIIASATGTAGGAAYIGLRGNSHARWNEICNIYDSYCRHLGVSIAVSLVSSITLLLLVWLSVYSLSKKIPRR